MKIRRSPYRIPRTEEMTPYLREVPVRILDLIKDFHITVTFAKMESGLSSSVEAKEKSFEIRINEDLGELRRRYAAAYELSRLLLDRNAVINHPGPLVSRLFGGPDQKGAAGPEQEAARLAISLLLPANGVRALHNAGEGPEGIGSAFLVPAAAARSRLQALALKPHPDARKPVTEPTGPEP